MNTNELNAEMVAALKALVELHSDWYAGRASITKKFEADNNAAIKTAKEVIAKAIAAGNADFRVSIMAELAA